MGLPTATTPAERSDLDVDGLGGGGYRPYLDGLRAVAVYLVVLFHAGVAWFVGGFVGVDVFFVLSGFLVTRLLLRDVDGGGGGRIGLRRFYARRFRRLLPAAFVVLLVTGLVYAALASPVEVTAAVGSFQAAFLYVTNWYFIRESADYFGADVSTNPVLHFWSLAVEEQFYLVWPLLLGGLFWLSRGAGDRQRDVVRVVVAVGVLASLVWAWSLRSSDPTRAYYGTDARAYQLLAGALLAFVPGLFRRLGSYRRWCRGASLVGLVGLVVVASTWVEVDAISRGVMATVVTVVLLVALEAAQGGLVSGGLSAGPVVYLGKISYGTYLWHWPVILVLNDRFDLSPLSTFGVTVLVATGLASLSFQVLEHPIRVSGFLDGYRGPVIAGGLAISVFSALVIVPAVVAPDVTNATTAPSDAAAGEGLTPVPAIDFEAIRGNFVRSRSCLGKPVEACTLVEGSGKSILLIGDSHAAMLIPTFIAIAKRNDLTLSVYTEGGCPWQLDLYESAPASLVPNCPESKKDLYGRVIPALDPDVVVAMNAGYEAPRQKVVYVGPDGRPLAGGSPEQLAWVTTTTKRSLDELRVGGRTVVLIEPVPWSFGVDAIDPLECLAEAVWVESCRFVVDPAPTGVEKLYQRLADEDPQVRSLNLDRSLCPFLPICDPIVGGQVVRWDESHVTGEFAKTLVPVVEKFLVSNRIVP